MAEPLFDVVFQGRIGAGRDPAEVRANLAQLFKIDAARIEGLFGGHRVVLKKGVDAAAGRNYQAALAKAGAETELAPQQPLAPEPVTAPRSVAEPSRPPPVAPPLTIAAPGVLLVEPVVVRAREFDTANLSLAEVGVALVEPPVITPPKFDLSHLNLAPPGTLLTEPALVVPAKIDTGTLALAER
ncbi:MAG: hypothetical protein HYX63_07280 [Gammaproteobacteria bacterium]|nr:hypothetical protein [Gammaproteobacteria bacterium]